MKVFNLIAICTVLLLSGCASTIKNTWVKEGYSPKKFDNILVLNISNVKKIRSAYEKATVELLEYDGIGATKGYDVFPLNEDFKSVSSKTIEKRVMEGNYDAILVSSVVGVDVRNKSDYFYENNTNSYYYPYASPYRDYIKHTYVYAHTSDFDREERQYLVESRLFDVSKKNKEDAVIWSGSTKISNPTELENVAEQYAQLVVHTLIKDGIILKP